MSEVLELIYEVVEDTNRLRSEDQELASTPDTVLVGDSGVLDSLGLINFLVTVEGAVTSRYGLDLNLIDEALIAQPEGPLHTLGNLASYIDRQRQ